MRENSVFFVHVIFFGHKITPGTRLVVWVPLFFFGGILEEIP